MPINSKGGDPEPIFVRQPQHPGVTHYLIHLYDYPPIAEKGSMPRGFTPRSFPDAAHAQHMPSHIFARRLLQESIDPNKPQRVAKEAADFR
jgi:hypothetical protein